MSARIRAHIRNNVYGLIAIFIVLGGTAWAAGTISSEDIINNQVKSVDVRDDTLAGGGLQAADLAANSVLSGEVGGNSLGGSDIDDTSLEAIAASVFGAETVGADPKPVDFTGELFDTDGMHSGLSTVNQFIRIPVDGIYSITGETNWFGGSAGGRVQVCILVLEPPAGLHRPACDEEQYAGFASDDEIYVTTVLQLDAGDEIELEVDRPSGDPVQVDGDLQVHFVGIP